MQRFFTIALLSVLVFPFIFKVSLVADYLVRYEYYQQVLCENQDSPELNCNGKCALAEKMRSSTSPKQPELSGFLEYEITPFLIEKSSLMLACIAKKMDYPVPTNQRLKNLQLDILSPPPKR